MRQWLLEDHLVYGDESRVSIARTATVNNAIFNVSSGDIYIDEYVFFGHSVCCVTGTHNYKKKDKDRIHEVPLSGRDIIIYRGAWIGTNVTIIGPCTIGEDSVVASGAVVTRNVPPGALVAGIPARIIRTIDFANDVSHADRDALPSDVPDHCYE